ncbi:hypothetical protein TSUD_235880 [Trifolium subterraneum]|nr:hypothetical protein TSUD_235880 [Trifolium subterraneum]
MALGNQTDHLALLQFKKLISNDPNGILDSWNSSTHFCNWLGIICSLKHQRVTKLKLEGNKLHGSISPYVGNLSHMRFLNLGDNKFNGNIPQELGRLSRLRYLLLYNNSLVGEFPINLTKCSELKTMRLAGNKLIGKIPSQIGYLQKLQNFYIGRNNLSGKIPPSIRNLSSLTTFSIGYNNLVGNMPQEMCFLKRLKVIGVYANKLSGTFPSCLYNISSLEMISAPMNNFSGSLPPNMFNTLPNLYFFGIAANQFSDVSENHLSGEIPRTIGECITLEYLLLQGNSFNGSIPFSLASLKGTNKRCLWKFNPSSNNWKQKTLWRNFTVASTTMPYQAIYLRRKRNQKLSSDSPTIDQISKVSYQDLHQGTDGFSYRNLIGSGSFGSVYKGNLESEDDIVAVKVLKPPKKGSSQEFHYYKGQEFKALVFEYMENGSLEQWLHPEILNAAPPTTLDLSHRLNIIIDVASALHYLHQECEQLVIHCDLKPSNVLLDNDMIAHVSDFGIARLVSVIDGTSHKYTSTIGIKGTIGYAPPEYGMGSEVSTCGDMYSFGILMLEMLTGKRPTDEAFEDGQNLHNFVGNLFPDNLIKILDPNIVSRDVENNEILIPSAEECLVSLFKIGLVCSMESPKERMNIVDVNRELIIIKKAFLAGEIN